MLDACGASVVLGNCMDKERAGVWLPLFPERLAAAAKFCRKAAMETVAAVWVP